MRDGMTEEDTILVDHTDRYDEAALSRMYGSLSSFGKNKVDTAGGETHRRQRILAYYLKERNAGERRYSISHSGRLVGVAASPCPVGIDLEEISRTDEERVQRVGRSHFFVPAERERLRRASVEEFLLVWTFKEAMTKLTQIPLARMLGEIDYYAAAAPREGQGDPVSFARLGDREIGDAVVRGFDWNERHFRFLQWLCQDEAGSVIWERSE